MKTHATSRPTFNISKHPCFYDGPSNVECANSFIALVQDLTIEIGIPIQPNLLALIEKSINSFVSCFFSEAQRLVTGKDVKVFTELCKQRKSDLMSVSNMIAVDNFNGIADSLFVLDKKAKEAIKLSQFRYLPKGIKDVFLYIIEDDLEMGHVTLSSNPRFYIYLYRMLFALVEYTSGLPEEFNITYIAIIRTLLLLPSSLAQIYEKMNPDKFVMTEYAEDILRLLQTPEKPLTEEFLKIFNIVKKDILTPGPAPKYVVEFRRALETFKLQKLEFKDSDYYTTLKSSTSIVTVDGKYQRNKSLVSSLYELDELKENPIVQKFDALIGYNSSYREEPCRGYKDLVIKTLMIPNPSKYKPRAIHIAQNAIQDRCKFVHRMLQPLLSTLRTDCMIHQHSGVDFLKMVSSSVYRRVNRNNILGSDFSNATDTLSQEFQQLCLGILFQDEVVDFWRVISQLPKVFVMPDGSEIPYSQTTGQPQGLLGSFDCFSLAHHILLLMLMQMSGLRQMSSTKFYRILGDDSLISFPSSNIVDVDKAHSWLCSEVSLLKNESKSTKSFFDESGGYLSVLIDFAKVSIFEGEFCSPLPSGLGLSYSHCPKITKLSAILWYNYHGLTFKKLLHHLLLTEYGDDLDNFIAAEAVMTSGQIPYLKNFEDKEISDMIDPFVKGCSIFSYGVAEIQQTLFGFFVSEDAKKKQMMKRTNFDSAWGDLLPTKTIENFASQVPLDHKYLKLLSKSTTLAEGLYLLYELNEPELADQIAILAEQSEAIGNLDPIVERLSLVKASPDSDDLTQLFIGLEYKHLFNDTKCLENLQVRSLRERMTIQSGLLSNSIQQFKSQFSLSSLIREGLNSSTLLIVDKLVKNIYSTYIPEEEV